ncbi:Mth938-like domain-containing protein [Streptomyces sp. NPDC096339]|uniref:Mth938-like domain-containing protein n=1 Tax=Streptomyces sp. NPDC096339 TaxID=3366086 RepID=UPI003820E5E3
MTDHGVFVPPVPASPRVTALEWGRMEVEGLAPAKDFVLYPGGGRPWDWSEHGTRHQPGIQPGDVRELLERGAEVIVLSRGMDLRLGTAPQTLLLLQEAGAEVHIEATPAAVERYNELAGEGRRVAGLFHSTC